MVRNVFTHRPVAMARVPLRPAVPGPVEDDVGLLAEGIFLASRATAYAADEPRIAATRRAYDIRSRARTTPHGVFSGVAVATFTGQGAALRLGAGHRTVTAPSPAWLAALEDQLLDAPGVLPRLILAANNLVARHGDRLTAEHPAPGAGTAQQSSVRATDVSLWLLDACRRGAQASSVLTSLSQRYPVVREEALGGAVRQMIRAGLLLTDLFPVDLRDDPLGHLLDRLPPYVSLRPALVRLRDLLGRADAHLPGTSVRLELLRAARRTADELVWVERPLTVDTFADASLTLSNAIGEQVAQAASILWRVSQLVSPAADYHQRFVRTYGHHRMVPLLDVIDPAAGIGQPSAADDIGTEGDIEPRRSALLARLVADATARGRTEVTLDDDLTARLAHDSEALPPRTAEIHVRLLRHGDELRIAVCPDAGSQNAGSAAGRFARWLPGLAPDTADPGEASGPLVAEIVCRPRTGPTGALAVETRFAPHRIPLGVPERDGDLTPGDLLVTTTRGHLSLWSARHQRPVVPVLFSRLAPDLLPPAARALMLIGHAGTRPWHTWSWGPAGYAPYTPRVRYRNILLAPARWRLPEELVETAAHRQGWDKALTAWHADTVPAPPEVVVVQEADRQIPLDLRQNEDRELLRRSVRRGANSVTEPLGEPDAHSAALHGPDGGHVLELVANLFRSSEPAPARLDPRSTGHSKAVYLPGSAWLSAAVLVPAAHQYAAVRQLPDVLSPAADHIDRWFWLRYHTPALGDHLRIRVHGCPDVVTAQVLPLLNDWCTALEVQRLAGGMLLEPYMPETERYGGPVAIGAAEEVFAADSEFTARCLALTSMRDDRLAVAAVSAVDIARTVTTRSREALRGRRLAASDRRVRDTLRRWVRTADDPIALVPEPLSGAWQGRHAALAAYRDALPDPNVSGLCASDLVHLHCNRLLGTDPSAEAIARSLATDLLHVHAERY